MTLLIAPAVVVLYQSTWALESDDKEVYTTIDKLMEASKNLARSKGMFADYMYVVSASVSL